jgi:hypothetical protein
MTTLDKMKLTNTKKPTQHSPLIQRRLKLSKRLWEQIELAKAQQKGETFSVNRLKTIKHSDGSKHSVEMPKRIRPWWFISDTNKVCLNVRYGARLIELAKGKTTIELNAANDLVSTLELIKSAIELGELDNQIASLSSDIKESFTK